MTYRPLIAATTLPPHVKRLVGKLERHYLGPTHALFRLPIPNYRIEGEFGFGISHLLLAAVAGLSTTLYEQKGKSGPRFQGLLVDFYPFATEPPTAPPPDVAARTLWSLFRNSLAHDLGFDVEKKAQAPETKVLRSTTNTASGTRGLTEGMIERLETSTSRPGHEATVIIRKDATVLSLETLYWGVRSMAQRLLTDQVRIARAEAFLASL